LRLDPYTGGSLRSTHTHQFSMLSINDGFCR
jgi:hypothetical protein